MGSYQAFDVPVELEIVYDGTNVRDGPDTGDSDVLYILPKGTHVEALGRQIMENRSSIFIVRFKIKGRDDWNNDDEWISGKCIMHGNGKNDKLTFAEPLDFERNRECFQLTHCPCDGVLGSATSPNMSFNCNLCGERIRSKMLGCRTCNWDACEPCQHFFFENSTTTTVSSHDEQLVASSPVPSYPSQSLITIRSQNMDQFGSGLENMDHLGGALAAAGVLVTGLATAANAKPKKVKKASSSYMKYSNDFELVIRATKDLEETLVTKCGAPGDAPLATKIELIYENPKIDLSHSTYTKMKGLVEIRNSLVNEYGFDELSELGRREFAWAIDDVSGELQGLPGKSQKQSGTYVDCIVM